jgi:1-acyl-sn-glycerol-3-phosphate acyltransferase
MTIHAARNELVAAILDFLAGQDLLALQDVRVELEEEIDSAGPEALLALTGCLASEHGWDYHPPATLAQRIHHRLADRFLTPDSGLRGVEQAARVAGVPVVMCANHLSYADANVIQVLLHRAGADELASRLTALAGPKVFSSRVRRFSSLCFGTIKVPQSAEVASEEARLNLREVARASRQAIGVARERLRHGDALVLFAEGTRSRTASMQPLLAAAARYLDAPGAWVLPVGLSGPETLFSVSDSKLRPAHVVMQIGTPIQAAAILERTHGDRRLTMDTIGLAIAELLPAPYRGVYARASDFPDAKAALHQLQRR